MALTEILRAFRFFEKGIRSLEETVEDNSDVARSASNLSFLDLRRKIRFTLWFIVVNIFPLRRSFGDPPPYTVEKHNKPNKEISAIFFIFFI